MNPLSYPGAHTKSPKGRLVTQVDPLQQMEGWDVVASCLQVSLGPCRCSLPPFFTSLSRKLLPAWVSETEAFSPSTHTHTQVAWIHRQGTWVPLKPVWEQLCKKAKRVSIVPRLPLLVCTSSSLCATSPPDNRSPRFLQKLGALSILSFSLK